MLVDVDGCTCYKMIPLGTEKIQTYLNSPSVYSQVWDSVKMLEQFIYLKWNALAIETLMAHMS